jgi:uncharacterized protein (TIGR02145 family)
MIKRITYFGLPALILAMIMMNACKKDINVAGIELDNKTLWLVVGGTATLKATVKPDNATDKAIVWVSSNDAVASVENGIVTAVSDGKATIIAKAGNQIATCEVTVIVEVQSINFEFKNLLLAVGEEYDLIAKIMPENATDKTIIWSSSNNLTATVSSSGKISAINEGTAKITAQAGNRTAECDIIVRDGIRINGIIWAKSNVNMPGVFAENPEDSGMFYQWDANIGWTQTTSPASSDGISVWSNYVSLNQLWAEANSPCPEGWRVPAHQELQLLKDAQSSWTTINGVNGRRFIDGANSIFLPAAGCFLNNGNTLYNVGSNGFYWSNAQASSSEYSYCFYIYISGSTTTYYSEKGNGCCIRCVSK